MRPFRVVLLRLICACAGALAFALAAGAAEAPKPKLIVAIAVDQLAAGLFDQYRDKFGHGFKRFLDQGALFPNGYQSHAATETCPGHSTLLSGRHPSGTGIIGNNWIDSRTGAVVYCVEDASVTVPGRPQAPRGPAQLRASTLGEWLRAADPDSRTVAVSGKDRGAIPMAGHDPDGVFWWDDERGFNTYLRKGDQETARLAPVAKFNAALAARWRKSLPQWQPIDTRCEELGGTLTYGDLSIRNELSPELAHDASKALRDDPAFKAWVRASPVLDRVTFELASELIDRYHLGHGKGTDLLAISFSATDYIGHRFGNQGPQMCDQLAHLDRLLGDLFKQLDRLEVPYVAVLSADHGGIDAAERVSERGFDSYRIRRAIIPELNQQLRDSLQLGFDPLSGDPQALYVSRRITDTQQRARVAAAAVAALRARSDVAAAFTKEEVLAVQPSRVTPVDELSLIERFAEGADSERSGDILVAYRPYVSQSRPRAPGDYIAEHGSPWNYDRRVPILFWRSGGKGFEQYLPVATVDIAPTLAALVGLAPLGLDGRCLDIDPSVVNTCGAP